MKKKKNCDVFQEEQAVSGHYSCHVTDLTASTEQAHSIIEVTSDNEETQEVKEILNERLQRESSSSSASSSNQSGKVTIGRAI